MYTQSLALASIHRVAKGFWVRRSLSRLICGLASAGKIHSRNSHISSSIGKVHLPRAPKSLLNCPCQEQSTGRLHRYHKFVIEKDRENPNFIVGAIVMPDGDPASMCACLNCTTFMMDRKRNVVCSLPSKFMCSAFQNNKT